MAEADGDGVHKFFSKIYSLAIFKIFLSSSLTNIRKITKIVLAFGELQIVKIFVNSLRSLTKIITSVEPRFSSNPLTI
ncbi:MAG: hypothetical protein ACKOXJ_04655 [Alphaproteobacteria bacterium]